MIDQVSGDLIKELEKATSLLQALKITDVKLRRDVDGLARTNCPFPAHPFRSPSLVVELSEPEFFHCQVCGAKGGVRAYVEAFCAPPPGTFSINSFMAAATESELSRRRAAGARSRNNTDRRIAADEEVIKVYECLLCELDLLDQHLEYFVRRELSAKLCSGNEYKSLPASRERRLEICERLLADGHCLEGIPGFFRIPQTVSDPNLRGAWCVGGDEYGRRVFKGKVNGLERRYEVGGILIPVRDANWQITRFEILNDLPDQGAPDTLKALWPPRLSLFTSPDQSEGNLTGIARLHWAGPVDGGGEFQEAVWVTDSALKADILAAVFGARVLGVTSFEHLWSEIIEAIINYERIIVALGHQEVFYPARLCREAAKLGIEPSIVNWNFEETITANDQWFPYNPWDPIPYDDWWSQCPSEIQEQVELQLLVLP
jgi:hypothetical protein